MNAIVRSSKVTLTKPTREVSSHGLAFIQHSEGLPGGKAALTAYQDSKGIWTIGWGHTAGVYAGMTCTLGQASAWMDDDLDSAENAVCRFVTVLLNPNQFDALVSFVFNIGTAAFSTSTLLRRLNAGDYGAVPTELAKWNKITWTDAKGVKQHRILDGLTNRRAAEAELWLVPADDIPPTGVTITKLDLPKIIDATVVVPTTPMVPTKGIVLSGEVPTAPPTTVAATPGGKTGIAALLTGGAGAIASGYQQVTPVIHAVRHIVDDTAGMGSYLRVFAVVLAIGSIGFMGWSLWKKRQEVKGA